MVNNVISAVSNALYNEFGSNHTIYADNVEQNLTRPCFYINVIRPAVLPGTIGRDKRSIPLVIQYFPDALGMRTVWYDVAERLFQCLKYPSYDGVIFRGTDLKYDVSEDKINFYVKYEFFTETRETDAEDTTFGEYESDVNAERKDDM